MKKYIPAILAFLFVFSLGACATTVPIGKAVVYDSSVSADESCYFVVQKYTVVTKFNDETVKWKPKFFDNTMVMRIPEGRHSITVEHMVEENKLDVKIIKMDYSFTAGRGYSLIEHPGTKELEMRLIPLGS